LHAEPVREILITLAPMLLLKTKGDAPAGGYLAKKAHCRALGVCPKVEM
jgi:hypothetical protein